MNPSKTNRSNMHVLTDLPNIGPAIADDLRTIGINVPLDLAGKNPLELYNQLNKLTGNRHDPCILDVFMSITDFMSGNDAQPWWAYTKKRKKLLAEEDKT